MLITQAILGPTLFVSTGTQIFTLQMLANLRLKESLTNRDLDFIATLARRQVKVLASNVIMLAVAVAFMFVVLLALVLFRSSRSLKKCLEMPLMKTLCLYFVGNIKRMAIRITKSRQFKRPGKERKQYNPKRRDH